MEEDKAELKIIECLRGRLVAERAASKAAEEDEKLMDSKLKELEAQLEKETKAMKKFEKKLSFLNKKLQSLRIPSHHDQSSESPSDEFQSLDKSNGKDSAEDSNTDSPRSKLEMEDVNGEVDNSMALIPLSICEEQSEVKISSGTKVRKKIEKKLSFLNKKLQSLRIPSHHDQSYESSSDEFHSLEISNGKDSAEDSNTDSPRWKLEMEDVNGEVDNSMALVPLSICEEQSEVKISSENVREVLGTLKHIREEIQRTMQKRQLTTTRQMIQVG